VISRISVANDNNFGVRKWSQADFLRVYQRIEITIKFDPTVVTKGSLEAGTYAIYTADSLSDLAAGNGNCTRNPDGT